MTTSWLNLLARVPCITWPLAATDRLRSKEVMAMGYDHSCFDEQAGQAPSQPTQLELVPNPPTQDVDSEARGLTRVPSLLPLEARRLIWEGALVLVLAPETKHPQDLGAPIGRRVEICLNRPWGRDLKRLVNDPAMPIICCEDDPNNQRRITAKLHKLGFQHIFTLQPNPITVVSNND